MSLHKHKLNNRRTITHIMINNILNTHQSSIHLIYHIIMITKSFTSYSIIIPHFAKVRIFSQKPSILKFSHNSSYVMHINPQFNHNLTYYHELKVNSKLTSHISTFHQSSSIFCLFTKNQVSCSYSSLLNLHASSKSIITVKKS